jgi:hypothetical protein
MCALRRASVCVVSSRSPSGPIRLATSADPDAERRLKCRKKRSALRRPRVHWARPLLLSFPGRIFSRHTSRAGPIACGDGRCLIHEEDAILRVCSSGYVSQGAGAIKSTVKPQLAVPTETSLDVAFILRPVLADKLESFDLSTPLPQ